ncbi:MAG: hypothetical protein IPH58_13005 [Sphingobacteriales bacterium]|nr:hypothetical protein [Sphingobacteriales bacterium]
MNSLFQKFIEANEDSDKIWHHGYQRLYPFFLDRFIGDKIKMLEIGYENGYSIKLWSNYFKNAIIHSADIIENPNDSLLEKYFILDQSNVDDLDEFVRNSISKYSLIIDDASHIPEFQWNTFVRLINLLKSGGVYIIEDIETSFWGKSSFLGYEFDARKTSIFNKLLPLPYIINQEFSQNDYKHKYNLSDLEANALSQIEMVIFGANCIILLKKTLIIFVNIIENLMIIGIKRRLIK